MSAIPDEQLRKITRADEFGRLTRAIDVCQMGLAGQIEPGVALREAELIVTGEADRIVRVGGPVAPLIQTGRD
jgi:hypothetical protein